MEFWSKMEFGSKPDRKYVKDTLIQKYVKISLLKIDVLIENFNQKWKFWSKIDILVKKIESVVKKYRSKNVKFGQKCKL